MTTTSYPIRLFGGRNLGVVYDSGAGTISVQGQSLTLSTLSATLQAMWANAVATTQPTNVGAFGGDNISAAVGAIMDAAPTWREAVRSAVANYVSGITANDPQTWTR